MLPFNRESLFTLTDISFLESAAGIPVRRTLSGYTQQLQGILGLTQHTNLDLDGVLNHWMTSALWLPPSWSNLLWVIRLLHLDELAQRMETYLSAGATEELSPTRGKESKLGK